MKKCVVVEKQKNKAIAITEDGEFIDMPLKENFNVGDVVKLGLSTKILLAIVLGAFLLLNACGWSIYGGVLSYWAPVTFLSVDINPSVQFTLNKSKKVVRAYGSNREGRVLLAGMDFKGMDAEDAVAEVVKLAIAAGYFDFKRPEFKYFSETHSPATDIKVVPNAVMLTVANDNDGETQKIKQAAYTAVDSVLDTLGIYGIILTENFQPEYWLDTQKYGVDLGKMQLVKLAQNCGVSFDDARAMSVKKLNEVISKEYGSTQQALDLQKELERELAARLQANLAALQAQQVTLSKLDSCAFAMDKTVFLNNIADIRYEMIGKWEDFKIRWQQSRGNAVSIS